MHDQMIASYMNVFLDELEEQLQLLDQMLLDLENEGGNETLQTIFRAAHTLKGSSAVMGFDNMKNLTHHVETIFDYIRRGSMQLNPDLMNILFRFIDYLRLQRESFLKGIMEELSNAALLQDLEILIAGEHEMISESATSLNQVEEDNISFLEPYVKQLEKKLEQGEVHKLVIKLNIDTDMPYVRALVIYEQLKEKCDVLVTNPTMASDQKEELFLGKLSYILSSCNDFQKLFNDIREMSQVESVCVESITPIFLSNVQKKQDDLPQMAMESKFQATHTVRVDVNRLEMLLNLVGELIIDHTRLQEVNKLIRDKCRDVSEVSLLADITSHFSSVISELQDGMMKTRMLPIEQLLNRFPRMIRDLAQQVNKEIELVIEGKETELDRTLIEEISDPLIHILRNSVDHGLELPEERIQLGKPRKGQVLIRASHEENAIVIRVSDDGKGIDPIRIKHKAIQKGFINQEEADRLSEKEIIALIFHSGMSTAEQVTDLSGRGVGMDIVRSQVEKLNGVIDIETELGKGTTIAVKIPLTLAIIRSLLVSLGNHTIALPLINIIEISRLQEQDIKKIHGKEVCMFRGEILPFIRMNELLQLNSQQQAIKQPKKHLFVVTIGMAEKRACLLFDHPIANQEIVVKSLGSYIGQVSYISGSTILGDGNIALILDVVSIIREACVSQHVNDNTQSMLHDNIREETKMVTFKLDSMSYGINICHVIEILPVPEITNISQVDQHVSGIFNLRGRLLPLYDLRQGFGVDSKVASSKSRVMIVDVNDRIIGLLVDEVNEVMTITIDEIDEVPSEIRSRNQAVSGIYKRTNQLVFILNIDHILNVSETELVS